MKKQVVILAAALLIMSFTFTFAQPVDNNGKVDLSKASIENYLEGLNSDNNGLRLSCAYYLGEYKVSDGIIPLMAMLDKNNPESERIMAALALTKIGTGKAIFAVKQAAQFDNSERVRNLCIKFYNHSIDNEENRITNL